MSAILVGEGGIEMSGSFFISNCLILIANILIFTMTVKLYTEILKNMLAGVRRRKDKQGEE